MTLRGERLDAVGQRRVGPEAGHQRPVGGGRLVGRRVEIVAERRPERRLVAARDADRIDDRGEAVVRAARRGGPPACGPPSPAPAPCARPRRAGRGWRPPCRALAAWRSSANARRLLGRLQRLGELGGGLGAALVLGLGEAVGAERLEIAGDGAVFRLEPGEAAPLLGGGGAERMAARVEVGRGGLRLG